LPLSPLVVPASEVPLCIAAVTLLGRLLIFPLADLPELPKGKGNKIIHIPPRDLKEGLDRLQFVNLIGEQQKLVIHAGKQFFALAAGNLQQFMGERGKRGKKLPRGFQRVTDVTVE
ncbi:MAG: DNA topoisomerase IV subunit A, partial [Desulfatitalea sp.]|nr:DNA topoisomerase IV subunit A [Desulfatitalea sp.]